VNYSDPLDPSNDFIDKDDLEARQAELRDRADFWELSAEEIEANRDTEAYEAGPLDRVEDGELGELEQVLDELGYGLDGPLINEDYFPAYARQLAEDINGDIYDSWPQSEIDWGRAAESLEMDYTTVEFGGQTWYVR
jgi:hypothetical protein